MSKAVSLIELIQLEYGLAHADIAEYCNVSREHISHVKFGKRRASKRLENDLENCLVECSKQWKRFTKRPYTWRAGRDVRRRKRPLLTARELYLQRKQATMPPPIEKPRCRSCQRASVPLHTYGTPQVLLCPSCAVARGYTHDERAGVADAYRPVEDW